MANKEIKAKRYTFRVVIEQDSPEEGRNFGTAEQWAELIGFRLDAALSLCNIVEVKPMRSVKTRLK